MFSKTQKVMIDFLFVDRPIKQLGLFRFILCSTLFYIACWRQINISQAGFFSMLPREDALLVYADYYRPYVEWFFWPDQLAVYVHILLIILLAFAAVGLSNRFFMLTAWVISQGFINRNSAFLFGADTIGALFLLYLSFTRSCDFFSLKKYLFKIKKTDQNKTSDLSSIFFRLCQIQICIIYAYTGFEKLKGNTWWEGTALWTVFANPQFSVYDLKFLSHLPWLFSVGTFLTIIFEVYFPVMILNKTYRHIWLWMGVFFHLGIGLLLGLMTFSTLMVSTYVLFLTDEELEKIYSILSQIKTKLTSFKS